MEEQKSKQNHPHTMMGMEISCKIQMLLLLEAKEDKRHKSFFEELMIRNEVECSHYKSITHNIATCTNLHLPADMFHKKKKKQAAKKQSG